VILVLPDRSVPSLVAQLLSKLFMKHVYLPILTTIDRSIDWSNHDSSGNKKGWFVRLFQIKNTCCKLWSNISCLEYPDQLPYMYKHFNNNECRIVPSHLRFSCFNFIAGKLTIVWKQKGYWRRGKLCPKNLPLNQDKAIQRYVETNLKKVPSYLDQPESLETFSIL